MTYRIIVSDGDEFVTYVGEVLEWSDEMTTIRIDTRGDEPKLITIAMACVVGAEEIAA